MGLTNIKVSEDPAGKPVLVDEMSGGNYMQKIGLHPAKRLHSQSYSSNTIEIFGLDCQGAPRIMIMISRESNFTLNDLIVDSFIENDTMIEKFMESGTPISATSISPTNPARQTRYHWGKIIFDPLIPKEQVDISISLYDEGYTGDYFVTVFGIYPGYGDLGQITLPNNVGGGGGA